MYILRGAHTCAGNPVNVKYKEQVYKEPLLVVKGDGPDLFGRNWLD